MTIHHQDDGSVAIEIRGHLAPGYSHVLNGAALEFVAALHRRFNNQRRRLLRLREERQRRYNAGDIPGFAYDTGHIRDSEWSVSPISNTFRQKGINVLCLPVPGNLAAASRSGSRDVTVDFEDGLTPSWASIVEGQAALIDRWQLKAAVLSEAKHDDAANIFIRPRALHVDEAHMLVDGEPVSAALFDFGLYAFHCTKPALEQGAVPRFTLAKLDGHLDARLWADVFAFAAEQLALPTDTIKATILIETLPAAFEMDEILYELRDHVLGLIFSEPDLISSYLRCLESHPDHVLPDLGDLGGHDGFVTACSKLMIKTCRHRGAFALIELSQGLGEVLPEDAAASHEVLITRAVEMDFDGVVMPHKQFTHDAESNFTSESSLKTKQYPGSRIGAAVLLKPPVGSFTQAGIRWEIQTAITGLEAWLRASNMTRRDDRWLDIASIEAIRAHIWHCTHHEAAFDDGQKLDRSLLVGMFSDEVAKIIANGPKASAGRIDDAAEILRKSCLTKDFGPGVAAEASKLIS